MVNPRFSDNEGDQLDIRIPPEVFTKVNHASMVILSYSILFNSVLWVLQVILSEFSQIVKNIWIISELQTLKLFVFSILFK